MLKKAIMAMLLSLLIPFTAYAQGTFASIVVDGDLSDWIGIPDLITDPSGDVSSPRPDFISLRVANDESFVYFVEEFASPVLDTRPDAPVLHLDTDLDPTTGCTNLIGVGIEYTIVFLIPTGGFIVDLRDCSGLATDFPGALFYVVAGNFIEASVPISTLEVLSPGLTAFDITAQNDRTIVARYNLAVELALLPVTLDIKPGSDPNSINCNNHNGAIPVAILTTDDFDATTVDHTTVTFEGASETHVNRRTGDARRHEEDVDGDGDTDLVLHFRKLDTELTCESTEGTLTGETFDGILIEGTDSINMVGGTTVITVGQPIPKGPKK